MENFKQRIPDSLKDIFEFANVCVNGQVLSANVKVADVHFVLFYHYDEPYYEVVFSEPIDVKGDTGTWTYEEPFESLVDAILFVAKNEQHE